MATPTKSSKTILTEIDIIKSVVKKRNYQIAIELLNSKAHSQAKEISQKLTQDQRQTQFKLALKVWQNLCKQVKSQMIDNDRVVDTLYYGSFAKAATISGDSKHTTKVP